MDQMTRSSGMPSRRTVSLPDDLREEIDNFRFAHRIKTDAEAVRQLITAGLKALGEST